MKKTLALSTFTLLISCWLAVGDAATAAQQPAGGQQAAGGPQWKSRAEYDAFTAMANEKDPNKKVSLAKDFLQKYPDSDYKEAAFTVVVQSYAQLNDIVKMMDATQQALQAKPESLDVITASCYFFPLLYKPDDPAKDAHLSAVEANAKKGSGVGTETTKACGRYG